MLLSKKGILIIFSNLKESFLLGSIKYVNYLKETNLSADTGIHRADLLLISLVDCRVYMFFVIRRADATLKHLSSLKIDSLEVNSAKYRDVPPGSHRLEVPLPPKLGFCQKWVKFSLLDNLPVICFLKMVFLRLDFPYIFLFD